MSFHLLEDPVDTWDLALCIGGGAKLGALLRIQQRALAYAAALP